MTTQAPKTALATVPQTRKISLYREPEQAFAAIQELQKRCIVLSPVSFPDFVPPFFELSLRIVPISSDVADGEMYAVPGAGGKLALTKAGLSKISAAAEVNWWPVQRTDDGSDPHFCEVIASGFYISFSGAIRQISASKQMDLRNGSAMTVGLASPKELAMARKHILAHAESKAKTRALREAFSILSGYTKQQLTVADKPRPFVVPCLALTGYHPDPELRRIFAEKMAEKALAGASALFGAGAPVAPQLAAPRKPPKTDYSTHDDDAHDEDEVYDRAAQRQQREYVDERPPPADLSPEPPSDSNASDESSAPGEPASTPPPSQEKAAPSGIVLRFGNAKGKTIEQVEDDDLGWYVSAVEASLEDPDKDRFKAANIKMLNALRAEAKNRGVNV